MEKKTFWLVTITLSCILIDLGIAFTVDRPINVLVQTWDAANPPADLSYYIHKTFLAFRIRCGLMIVGFTSLVGAFFLHQTPPCFAPTSMTPPIN